jgi:hypothetical protein
VVESALMSYRVTAAALAVLVVLGGIVWFTEFRDKDSSSSAAAKPSDKPEVTVLKFDDKDTRKLEVATPDRRVQADRNEQGDWTLQPSGEAGDRSRLSGVLFRLSSLNATRLVTDAPSDLAQYGLDTPALTVTVTQADGSTIGLLAGAKAPSESGTYVKKPNEATVYLIANPLVTDLQGLVSQPPVAPPTPSPAPSAEPVPTPGG